MANSVRLGLTASLCQDLLPGGCIDHASPFFDAVHVVIDTGDVMGA